MEINFKGEIKEFKCKKMVTNDKQATLVVITGDPKANALIQFEPEVLYNITISEDE